MLNHTDLRKGTLFIYNSQPHEVLDFSLNFKGRGSSTVSVKIKNLISGNVVSKTFHTGDNFEEAEIETKELKFLYQSRGQYFFCEAEGPSKRFFLTEEQVGEPVRFLKPNQIVKGFVFNDQFINIELPVKVQLKVAEAPPGIKADRSEAGMKQVVLETGATISTPLFVKQDDVIEVNTQTGEYTRRVE